MCTVSITTPHDVVRLVVNRDELRSRALSLPPTQVDLDGVRALMPIDPESGGTWVACTDAGLTIALLNVNVRDDERRQKIRSRGDIVPQLARHLTLGDVANAALALDVDDYLPFRIVSSSLTEVVEISPARASVKRWLARDPLMFTSSGLGDDRVDAPRRELFTSLVLTADSTPLAVRQDAFHAHRWTEKPEISVWMDREEAATVSRTIVEMGANALAMIYAAAPDWSCISMKMFRDTGSQRADSSR